MRSKKYINARNVKYNKIINNDNKVNITTEKTINSNDNSVTVSNYTPSTIYTFEPDTTRGRQFINFSLYNYSLTLYHYYDGIIDINSNHEGTLMINSESSNYVGDNLIHAPIISNANNLIYLKQNINPIFYPSVRIYSYGFIGTNVTGVPNHLEIITVAGGGSVYNPNVIPAGTYQISFEVLDYSNRRWKITAQRVEIYSNNYRRFLDISEIIFRYGTEQAQVVDNDTLGTFANYDGDGPLSSLYLYNVTINNNPNQFSSNISYLTIS